MKEKHTWNRIHEHMTLTHLTETGHFLQKLE